MKLAVPWKNAITSLIFDLDGVLIQSRDAHARAFQEVLADFAIHDFEYADFAGWRTPDVFRRVLQGRQQNDVTDEVIAQCSERKSRLARELMAQENPITPDCVPVVNQLSESYRLALASSGSRQSVRSFLDNSGLRSAFCSVLCGEDVERAKPDPEIFRRSIENLGARPEECAVVEDAPAGILAAREAGAHAIGFGDQASPELSAAGAERVVGSLRELTILLGAS